MYSTLYKKADVELPYNVDTRMYKWVQEGETKQKYEQKWVVLTEEANSFIEQLPHSYEGLCLQTPNREDRGPLTVVTVSYGDNELSEDYVGDGEISWWTLSSGVYTYHVKKWVTNTPDNIKSFCEHCKAAYGYEDHEVSVTCNPVAGEPRVMCEATFTEDIETDEENDPTTGGGGDEPEDEVKEETQSVNCSSSIDTIGNTKVRYAQAKYGGQSTHILALVDAVEGGRVAFRKAGDFGGRIKTDGWYSTDDTNPNALDTPVYTETQGDVAYYKASLETIPDIRIPTFRVSLSNKVTSKNKITTSSMTSKLSGAGSTSQGISSGSFNMAAPAITEVKDTEGYSYSVQSCEWMYEGGSYDVTSTRKRKSAATGNTFYEGTSTDTYISILYLACESSSASATL